MENSSGNLARMGFPVYKIPPEKGDFYDQIQLPGTYRQKIEDDRAAPVYIRTISNLSYQFMPTVSAESVEKDS